MSCEDQACPRLPAINGKPYCNQWPCCQDPEKAVLKENDKGFWCCPVHGSYGKLVGLGEPDCVLPGTTVTDMSAAIGALEQMQALVALDGYLGRIEANFGSVSQSGGTVVTAGGDLFKIAAAQYGQAQAWTTIAAANGLADPVIQGVQTLQVPGAPDQNDGILES